MMLSALCMLHLVSFFFALQACLAVRRESSHAPARDVKAPSLLQMSGTRSGSVATTQLFIDKRTDGLGETVKHMIYGMALAEKFGMRFGGMVGGAHVSHGVNVTALLYELLGTTGVPLLPDAPVPFVGHIIDDLSLSGEPSRNLGARLHKLVSSKPQPPSCLIQGGQFGIQRLYDAVMHHNGERGADSLLTPTFLSSLRAHAMPALQAHRHGSLSGSRPLVAMHVRRGDVTHGREGHGHRLTSDQWYFSIAEQIRQRIPNCDVHIFSSTEGRYTASDFEGYRRRNMTVHLDTDPAWDWAQMSAAEVLVMAKSAYSHAPALLNRNCIIYQPYWSMPLGAWIRASRSVPPALAFVDMPTADAAANPIADCYARVAARQPRRRN